MRFLNRNKIRIVSENAHVKCGVDFQSYTEGGYFCQKDALYAIKVRNANSWGRLCKEHVEMVFNDLMSAMEMENK